MIDERKVFKNKQWRFDKFYEQLKWFFFSILASFQRRKRKSGSVNVCNFSRDLVHVIKYFSYVLAMVKHLHCILLIVMKKKIKNINIYLIVECTMDSISRTILALTVEFEICFELLRADNFFFLFSFDIFIKLFASLWYYLMTLVITVVLNFKLNNIFGFLVFFFFIIQVTYIFMYKAYVNLCICKYL